MVVMSVYFLLLSVFIGSGVTQFVTVNRKPAPPIPCNRTTNTVLVERFFSIIFNEFQNVQPVCVCVRMCIGQAMYCYPNGCIKRLEPDKIETSTTEATVNVAKIKSLMHFFDGDKNVEGDVVDSITSAEKTKATMTKNLRPDPFNDKYMPVYKYSKIPKVQLTYNLREHMKNSKINFIKLGEREVNSRKNVGNIINKNKLMNAKKIIVPKKTFDGDIAFSLGFLSESLSKYFKRDLMQAPIKKNEYASNFSLENIIENMIEDTFSDPDVKFNDTQLDISINLEYSLDNDSSKDRNLRNSFQNTLPITLRSEDNNLHRNGSEGNVKTENKNYELINILSNEIDKNNNTSMNMLRRAIQTRKTLGTERCIADEAKLENKDSVSFQKKVPEAKNMKGRRKLTRKLHGKKRN